MSTFEVRRRQRELIDDPSVPGEELEQALEQLEVINRWLGGYRPSIAGVERLLPPGCRAFSLLDVGTGCGDFPRRLVSWARRMGIEARVTGIDILQGAVDHARSKSREYASIEYRNADLFGLSGQESFDVVHAAMVLHHFDDRLAPRALEKMYALSRRGIVINDIHRHAVAYHSIKLLTRCFSRNRLIRADAPVSVLRAFKRKELRALCLAAGLPAPEIRWRWAFRWQAVIPK